MEKKDSNITKYLVITIVALIIGIIVYPVCKTIAKDKEKETFEAKINSVITTAKAYYRNNTDFTDEYVAFTIEDGKIIEDGLGYDGLLPELGSVLINNDGDIQIVASDSNWCATKRYGDETLNIEEFSNSCEVVESIKFGKIDVTLSTKEDGLYQDGQEYYYRGENPNNYIEMDSMLFRIVSIDENKNIKIVSNENLYDSTWNIESLEDNDYDILDESNIAYSLNYLETSNQIFNNLRVHSNILEYNWISDKFNYTDNKLYSEIKQDQTGRISTSSVGLLSSSEYIRASLNNNCIFDSLRNSECGIKNFLNTDENYFTMSISNDSVWAVNSEGKLYETSLNIELGIRPVIVLSSEIEILGKGTIDNPYKLLEK